MQLRWLPKCIAYGAITVILAGCFASTVLYYLTLQGKNTEIDNTFNPDENGLIIGMSAVFQQNLLSTAVAQSMIANIT